MNEYLVIFGIKFYYYGVIIGVAVILLLQIMQHELKVSGVKLSNIAILIILICAFIGGKTFYCIGYNQSCSMTMGGISLFGVLTMSFLATYVAAKIARVNPLLVLDGMCMGLPLAQAVGRLGNYINQELYGLPTQFFMKIFIEPGKRISRYEQYEYFHPIFAYEALLNLCLFLIIIIMTKKHHPETGMITALYLIGYGIIRTLINLVRIDTPLLLGINMNYFFSIGLICSGFLLFIFIKRKDILESSN